MERAHAFAEGLMLSAGQELGRDLRDAGPEGARGALETFLERGESGVAGVDLAIG